MTELRFRFRVQGSGETPWSHDLDIHNPTVIGRAGHCDLILEEDSRLVSKEHAMLERSGGEWLVSDLGSKNGTRLNDVSLEQDRTYSLSSGDRLTIGGFELVLEAEAPPDPSFEAEKEEDDPTTVEDAELGPVTQPMSAGGEPVELEEVFEDSALQNERIRHLLRALSRATALVISIPDRFRHEFFGITIPGESLYHLASDPDRLLVRLMDPATSGEQFESLVAQIEESVRRVMNHQLAMLEGYRSCVKLHVSITAEKLDPERLRELAREQGSVSSKIPLLLDHEIVKVLEEEHRQSALEDWSAIEQSVFRKVFRDAYLSRTS